MRSITPETIEKLISVMAAKKLIKVPDSLTKAFFDEKKVFRLKEFLFQ